MQKLLENPLDLDQIPDNTLDLAQVEVRFAYLERNDTSGCPVTTEELVSALDLPIEPVKAEQQLQFIRTAQVSTKEYWLWRLRLDDMETYVAVCRRANGDITLSYEENYGNWTPEQFLLGEYHGYFFDHWVQYYTVRYPPDHPAFANLGVD